ncbi:MAG: ABC transporter permease [Oscillospiraceae bacterium]|jgi:spermidine/putrescine transport system permease protein|nr:ABC transporter permease [Oscillospiraceae bacterium]
MRKKNSPWLNAPYVLWSALFILAPLALVAVFAFTDQAGRFSLASFEYIAQNQQLYLKTFGDSLAYALEATVICLLLAFPLAYFMANARQRTQRLLMMLIMVPMWMNFVICTYSWRSILEDHGILNTALAWLHGLVSKEAFRPPALLDTPGAVVLGMVYNYLPFMILPIYTVMSKLEPSLTEAAQDLGANRWRVLEQVVVPLSIPGVVSGVTMVFVPSVSTFYISQKLGGGSSLIGDLIELQFLGSAYNFSLGAALSLILMAIVLVCMLVMKQFSDGEESAFVV